MGSAPEDPAARLRRLPAWLRPALARRGATADPAPAPGSLRLAAGPPQRLVEASNARGVFAARSQELDPGHVHGDVALGEVAHARASTLSLLTRCPALEGFDPLRAVYLDIETTGLSGGAGTHVFLVGLGRFESGRFVMWQGFLRHPGEAAALLEECAARIRASDALVSFFGKSFDRHRLEDSMRLARVEPPFRDKPHLDLYHPCRRLYGRALPDSRLATMERVLCGVEREDDLPGSLAPAAYFDYLGERPHRLEQVFRHNLLDVLSLVGLCAHLGRAEDERRAGGAALCGPAAARAEAFARLHLEGRRREAALSWIERALERSGARADLRLMRARTLRRLDRCDEALAELRELQAQSSEAQAECSRERARILRRARALGQSACD